jgi:uncharacterized membrane protein YebE (DUF533 family)
MLRQESKIPFYPGSKTMFQEILQTILTSVIARITTNISSVYIAIGATLAVVVCGYFLYKQYFSDKPVEKEKEKEKTVTFEEPVQEPVSREEAFAATMQAEQESVEQELKKRQALIEPDEHMEQSEHTD